MKITYFLGEFPLVTENFIIYEIDALIRQGEDVEIFSLGHPVSGKMSEQPQKLGFSDKIHYANIFNKSRLNVKVSLAWLLLKLLLKGNISAFKKILKDKETCAEYSRYQLLAIADRLKKVQPDADLIVSHFGPTGRVLAILKEYDLLTMPFTTTFHGYDITSYLKTHGEEIYNLLFRNADQLIFVSDFFRQKAIELGASEKNLCVIHTSINCEDFSFYPRQLPQEGSVRFICVGRLTEKKGQVYLLEAFAKICSKLPTKNIHLDLVGGGPLEETIRQKAKELNVEEYVTIHGSVQHEVVKELLAKAHVFILHSIVADDGDMEGIPCSLMEAMAQGLPVISTYHSGIPELIDHNVSGLLGEERDVDVLEALMMKFINEPQIWADMTKAAREKVEDEFERKKETQRLIETFEKTIAASKASSCCKEGGSCQGRQKT